MLKVYFNFIDSYINITVFRNFQLTLRMGTNVLAEEFKAYVVDGDERKKAFAVDQILVFTGHRTGV